MRQLQAGPPFTVKDPADVQYVIRYTKLIVVRYPGSLFDRQHG